MCVPTRAYGLRWLKRVQYFFHSTSKKKPKLFLRKYFWSFLRQLGQSPRTPKALRRSESECAGRPSKGLDGFGRSSSAMCWGKSWVMISMGQKIEYNQLFLDNLDNWTLGLLIHLDLGTLKYTRIFRSWNTVLQFRSGSHGSIRARYTQ